MTGSGRKEVGAAWTNWLLEFGGTAPLREIAEGKSPSVSLAFGRKKFKTQLYPSGSIASPTTSTTTLRRVKAPTPPRLPSRWTLLHPPRLFAAPVHHLQRADRERLDRSVPADDASRTNAHAGATVTPLRTPHTGLRTSDTDTAAADLPSEPPRPQAKWPCTEERRSEQEADTETSPTRRD